MSVKAQAESNPVNEVKRAFAVENMKLMFDRRSDYEFRSLTFKWFSKYLAPLQYFALCIVCSVFSLFLLHLSSRDLLGNINIET